MKYFVYCTALYSIYKLVIWIVGDRTVKIGYIQKIQLYCFACWMKIFIFLTPLICGFFWFLNMYILEDWGGVFYTFFTCFKPIWLMEDCILLLFFIETVKEGSQLIYSWCGCKVFNFQHLSCHSQVICCYKSRDSILFTV